MLYELFYPERKWLTEIKLDDAVMTHQCRPHSFHRRRKGLHCLGLAQLFSDEIPVHQTIIVDSYWYQQCVLDSAIHVRVNDDAENAALRHARLAGSRATTLHEEFYVVPGTKIFHYVRLKNRAVKNILAACHRVDTTFDKERTQVPQKPPAKVRNEVTMRLIEIMRIIRKRLNFGESSD